MIRKRKKKEKKSNLVDNINKPNNEFKKYQQGGFIGGLLGGLTGLIIQKRIILCIGIGIIAGGFIAYELNKEGETGVFNLKKFRES